ncbi:MAG: glutamate--tRNA ligase, partial [Deltaproteobacteria bacterium]
MPNVVTRFAPSPTGSLHIGGVRTALFSWLYARRHGGKFILRIEDTDQERSTPENVQVIVDGLTWLGIDWDEGPYFQTRRLDLYRAEAERLLSEGKAYRCVCTKEDLDARRKEMEARKEKPRYDGRCRNVPESAKAGKPSVIRFRTPLDGETEVRDLVLKKTIAFRNAELDDLILIRTDGWPTYNFVVAVDDASMGVTHVLRGDDHLNNTPKQILIYGALGHPAPQFGHFPLIHGTEGGKMSKREGKDFDDPSSLGYYPRHGFLPEAVVNYLARLGWGHGDQEIFAVAELKSLFSLEGTNNSPSRFDMDKLLHLNAHYIKTTDPARVAALLVPFLKKRGIEAPVSDRLVAIVRTLNERARTLDEMAEAAVF